MTGPYLNAAALRAVGYDKNARISRLVRCSAIAMEIPRVCSSPSPTPTFLFHPRQRTEALREDQLNSSRLFFRELNRFGITTLSTAGADFRIIPTTTA